MCLYLTTVLSFVGFQMYIKAFLIVLEMSHNILIPHFSEDLREVRVSSKFIIITCEFWYNHPILCIISFSIEIYYHANHHLPWNLFLVIDGKRIPEEAIFLCLDSNNEGANRLQPFVFMPWWEISWGIYSLKITKGTYLLFLSITD